MSIWGLFPDCIENAKIGINRKTEKIKFINCSGHAEGETVVLSSVLEPYKFVAIEIKNKSKELL